MRFILITFIIITGSLDLASGQRTPVFPEYDHNPFIINPAYAGMTTGSVTSLSHYRHVRNIEGAPRSSSLSHHFPLSDGKMGLGAIITDEKIGVTANTSAVVAYSYKLFFGAERRRTSWKNYAHVFSFGITAGAQRLHENLLALDVEDDPRFSENISETIPVVGAGFLYNKDDFFIGASVPDLLGKRLASRNNIDLSTPAYGYAGYRVFVGRFENILLKPGMLIKYEKGAPIQIDVNLAATLNNRVELGAGYRSASSLNFLVGIYPIEQLRVIYYYNAAFQGSALGNNHGITASFAFDFH